ncbi:MAG TPA: hypothetical protein VEJ67_06480 [Candidatus Cybelea sp.]|nr:hypothetical protein [Candidatus Cybelea sp.]
MWKICLPAAVLVAALATMGHARTARQPLTNGDVVTMFKGRLGESTIISAVQSQDTGFDISALALLRLKKIIPPKIMNAVIGAAKKQKAASDASAAAAAQREAPAREAAKAGAAAPPVAPGQPSVLMLQGDRMFNSVWSFRVQ